MAKVSTSVAIMAFLQALKLFNEYVEGKNLKQALNLAVEQYKIIEKSTFYSEEVKRELLGHWNERIKQLLELQSQRLLKGNSQLEGGVPKDLYDQAAEILKNHLQSSGYIPSVFEDSFLMYLSPSYLLFTFLVISLISFYFLGGFKLVKEFGLFRGYSMYIKKAYNLVFSYRWVFFLVLVFFVIILTSFVFILTSEVIQLSAEITKLQELVNFLMNFKNKE